MSPATPHHVNSPKDKPQPNQCIMDWQINPQCPDSSIHVPRHLLLTSQHGCKAHRKFTYSPNDLNHHGFYSCSKPHQRGLVGIFKYSLHRTCWAKNLPKRCCHEKLREVSQQLAWGSKAGWKSLIQHTKGDPKLTHHLERTVFTHRRSTVRL